MKNYLKGGLKVLTNYLIILLVFIIFLYPFVSIARDKFLSWLPVYSSAFFLLLFAIIYTDIKKLALKEKRPQYELNPYPLKGLIYGLIGFLPVMVLELIYPFIAFNSDVLNRLKELALNTIVGPLYFLVKLCGGGAAAYIIASLVVPVISMISYMAGYYDFGLGKFSKKAPGNEPKKFEKSPWNPSAGARKDNRRSQPGSKKS